MCTSWVLGAHRVAYKHQHICAHYQLLHSGVLSHINQFHRDIKLF